MKQNPFTKDLKDFTHDDFSRLVIIVMVSILIGWFGYYIWPTPYRHSQITLGGDTFPVRIHRTSGKGQVYFPGQGWSDVESR